MTYIRRGFWSKIYKYGNSPREIVDGRWSGRLKWRTFWLGQRTSVTVEGRRLASTKSREVFKSSMEFINGYWAGGRALADLAKCSETSNKSHRWPTG
jgi:hypothetical protein